MADQRAWRVLDLIEWTTAYFTERGIETARLDAELLLAHTLKQQRMWLYLNAQQIINEEDRATFRAFVKRRANREPVAYLIGKREFYSLDFEVNAHVLIPRPETEFLVETVVSLLRKSAISSPKIIDVGTGSGIVAVTLATELTARNPHIVGVDISQEALEVAARNAETHGVAERIAFVQSDLFEHVEPDDWFDAIVSNPPYIPTDDLDGLQPEVSEHEPRAALDGGADGLDIIRRLIVGGATRLVPGGIVALEIGANQSEVVAQLVADTSAFDPPEIIQDYGGIDRIVVARRK
ncbi:MAG: peptide chain release factor N(5)-glutamine methyltransferase [Candidatus Poribacteria bacterium]|nr:peptide chain release factor N(5)-glutamine methyltransferase [Candidatus Poribacteria bacterium]